MRRRWNGWLFWGIAILLLYVVLVAAPGLFANHGPHEKFWPVWDESGSLLRLPLKPGEAGTPLGSDMQGRDLWARMVWGARTSLGLALGITVGRLLIALPLGLWSGWSRTRASRFAAGFSNAATALPVLLILVLLLKPLQTFAPMLGRQWLWYAAFCGLVILSGVPRAAESIRRRVEVAAESPHLEGAIALGANRRWLLNRHVMPFLLPELAVMFTAEIGWVLLLLGQLGVLQIFVGGGEADYFAGAVHDLVPEWGQMLAVNRGAMVTSPILIMVPGLALALAAIGFHVTSEGLRRRWQHLN